MATNMADSDDDEADVRLMEHNRRFQDAVLSSMERQMDAMQTVIVEKQSEAADAGKARERMALALGLANKELKRVHDAFQKSNKNTEEAQSRAKILSRQLEGCRRDLQQVQLEKQQMHVAAEKQRAQVSALTARVESASSLRGIYASDLKAQQTVVESLKMEVETLKKQLTQTQAREGQVQKDNEKAGMLASELKRRAEIAEAENLNTQSVFAKLRRDMEQLEASRDAMVKQWEHAVNAMTQRDQVISHVSSLAADAKRSLHAAEATETSLAEDNKRLEAEASALSHKARDVGNSKERLEKQLARMKAQKESLQLQLTTVQGALHTMHQEHQKALKRIDVLKDASSKSVGEANELRGATRALEHDKARLDSLAERRAKAHEQEARDLEVKYAKEMGQLRTELAEANHALSKIQLEELEKKRQQALETEETAQMRVQVQNLVKEMGKLAEEKYIQEMQMERLREQLMRTKEKITSQSSDYEEQLKYKVQELQRNLEAKEAEVQQYSRALISAERRNAHLEQLRQETEERAHMYQAKSKQADILSEHDRGKVSRLSHKEKVRNRETALLELRASKQEEQAAKIRVKNAILEEKLQTETYRQQVQSSDHEAHASLLQAASSTLQTRCNMLQRDVQYSQNQMAALQSKLSVTSERLSKEKEENKKLSKKLFEASQRLKMQERMMQSTKALSRMSPHMESVLASKKGGGLSSVAADRSRQSSGRRSGAGVSLTPLGRGGSSQDHETQKQLKRATTQAAERLHEILLLKEQLQQATDPAKQTTDLKLAQKFHKVQLHTKNLEQKLVETRERLLRSHAVAAKLELDLTNTVADCKCRTSLRFKKSDESSKRADHSPADEHDAAVQLDYSPDFSLVSSMSPALRDALGGVGPEVTGGTRSSQGDMSLVNIRSAVGEAGKGPRPPHGPHMHQVASTAVQLKRFRKQTGSNHNTPQSASRRLTNNSAAGAPPDDQLNKYLVELRSL